ncbi:hypothetical protein NDU88_000613 [Pleurodeles waltl]|uniref:Uncharacterized protein n=1 Tax=Pleurodeles waltl TaxID=8319 RepID=A0AAV7WG05_PLEWA|nr:hypothetical protein NDU88_000613 [Pleurodeles waltl]
MDAPRRSRDGTEAPRGKEDEGGGSLPRSLTVGISQHALFRFSGGWRVRLHGASSCTDSGVSLQHSGGLLPPSASPDQVSGRRREEVQT